MIRFRSSTRSIGVLVLTLILLVGCGGKDDSGPPTAAADQPPSVEITAPSNGAILPAGQAVLVNVLATDDQAIARIELYVDSFLIESRVTPAGSAYTTVSEAFTWSASIIGPHTLQARTFDSAGQLGASRVVGVEVLLPGTTPIAPESSVTPQQPGPPVDATATSIAPTAPPATATSESSQVTANVNANVRGGPGTNYPVVGGLAEGASAPVTGRNADSSWWQINYQGSAAWIANSVVTASPPAYNAPVVSAPPPPPTNTPVPPTATSPPPPPTNPPAPSTGLWADQVNLSAGQCTTLHWNFPNIKAFYISLGYGYDKEGKPGTGTQLVCPSLTTQYQTTVVRPDGTQEFPSLTINVGGSGCGDPYISQFAPTTYSVAAGTPFSIFWKVDCAKTVRFIRVGESEEPVAGHGNKIDVVINRDTIFQLKVEKNSGEFVYASFSVDAK